MPATCPSCGLTDPSPGRFCRDCETPLSSTCPSCSAPVQTQQRFCGDCGTALGGAGRSTGDQAQSLPLAERRVCSVLFCDLVGFTPLSESRDPEEVRELLSRRRAH
ncbi:MAG: zinc ribbon domain-containing protein [Jatrophihabitans sp.]|uniref:double zinc ribbon domain-containing protein n=1 Tax=Jatrophihabitans sp. TaxID=1932789 RepID=UPI003912434E